MPLFSHIYGKIQAPALITLSIKASPQPHTSTVQQQSLNMSRRCINYDLVSPQMDSLAGDIRMLKEVFVKLLSDSVTRPRTQLFLSLEVSIRLGICKTLWATGKQCFACAPPRCEPIEIIDLSSDSEDEDGHEYRSNFELPIVSSSTSTHGSLPGQSGHNNVNGGSSSDNYKHKRFSAAELTTLATGV